MSKPRIRLALQAYFLLIVAALILLLLGSWVVGVYVDGVNGLLTPQGIRWMCAHIIPNYAAAPWAETVAALVALGVLRESGLFAAFRSHASLKQRRALLVTGGAALALLGGLALLLLPPNAILLSAFGTVAQSPFTKGLYGLAVCLLVFLGNVYGYTSGRFAGADSALRAHVRILSSVSGYFVLLFFVCQLVGCFEFTHIHLVLGIDDFTFRMAATALRHIPLILYVLLDW